jgi:hypothetical protein
VPSEQFLKTHWHVTNMPRWVNTRHIVSISPSYEPDAGADVYLIGDDENNHHFVTVNETPDELLDQLTALIDQQSVEHLAAYPVMMIPGSQRKR